MSGKGGAATPSSGIPKIPAKRTQPMSVASCSGCGVVITDDTKTLQCDSCQAPDSWKCAECLSLSDDMYDKLVSDSGITLCWFCDQCDNVVMGKPSRVDGQTDKLEQLIVVIEKLMAKYDNFEQRLASKCDSDRVTELEERIKAIEGNLDWMECHLEKRVDNLGTAVEGRLIEIESKAAPGVQDVGFDHGVTDEEVLRSAVEQAVKSKADEDKDIEVRKRNIIIFRIPKKKNENVQQRKEWDVTFVKDLLDCVFDVKLDDSDVDRMYPLGRWDENKTRPLLVSFRNLDVKEEVMSNLRRLKQTIEKFQGISISHDLHPKEREQRRKLIEAAMVEHASSSEDRVENFKFFVVGRGSKQKGDKNKKAELFSLSMNARSIVNKMDELQATVFDLKPDIIGITELDTSSNI